MNKNCHSLKTLVLFFSKEDKILSGCFSVTAKLGGISIAAETVAVEVLAVLSPWHLAMPMFLETLFSVSVHGFCVRSSTCNVSHRNNVESCQIL